MLPCFQLLWLRQKPPTGVPPCFAPLWIDLPGYKAALTAQLCHVEAVVVHVPEDGDDVAGAEGQLHLFVINFTNGSARGQRSMQVAWDYV